jgi:hypothetical protein
VAASTQMGRDTRRLLKFGLITALLIAGWFELASVSHNVLLQLLLGWVGLGVVVLYWRWLQRNKLRPPKS